MKWPWSKKVEEPTKIVHKSELFIYMYSGKCVSLVCTTDEDMGITVPWKDFYTWWYVGKSEKYNLPYNKGVYVIQRKDISYIHINKKVVNERYVDHL